MHASVRNAGSRRLGRWGRRLMLAALGLALVGCPATKMEEELKAEVKAVKAEVQTLKEKLAALEAGQKDIMAAVQKLQAAPPPKEAPPGGTIVIPPPGSPLAPGVPGAPGAVRPETAAGVLTVGELIKNKDRYLGSRVTVKGEPGPVLVHKRLFHLRAPEGMVEVLFGNLGDKAQIERLTSQVLPTEIKVTGTLVQASGQGPSRLQITAESVEF